MSNKIDIGYDRIAFNLCKAGWDPATRTVPDVAIPLKSLITFSAKILEVDAPTYNFVTDRVGGLGGMSNEGIQEVLNQVGTLRSYYENFILPQNEIVITYGPTFGLCTAPQVV